MITRVILSSRKYCGSAERDEFERISAELSREFACNVSFGTLKSGHTPSIALADFRDKAADIFRFDTLIHQSEDADFELVLEVRDPDADRPSAFQVLTRYQRLLPLRSPLSEEAPLIRALELHRSLHDLRKPLVRADFDHSLDTRRWVLRLDPKASVALQIAALFHDIERLTTEPDRRIEHRARDYRVFKQAHAEHGSKLMGALLERLGLEPLLVARAAELVAAHESPSKDPDLMLLNDADALSFFSLNSWGFFNYFGLDHTRTKIAYTIARMRPEAQSRLLDFRYHPEVERLIRLQLQTASPRTSNIQDQP